MLHFAFYGSNGLGFGVINTQTVTFPDTNPLRPINKGIGFLVDQFEHTPYIKQLKKVMNQYFMGLYREFKPQVILRN